MLNKTIWAILTLLILLYSCKKNDEPAGPANRLKQYAYYDWNNMITEGSVYYYENSRLLSRVDSIYSYGHASKDGIMYTIYSYRDDQSVTATTCYVSYDYNPPDTSYQAKLVFTFEGDLMKEKVQYISADGITFQASMRYIYNHTGNALSEYTRYVPENGNWIASYEGRYTYSSQTDTFRYYSVYGTPFIETMVVKKHQGQKVSGYSYFSFHHATGSLEEDRWSNYIYSPDGRLLSEEDYYYNAQAQEWQLATTVEFSYTDGLLTEVQSLEFSMLGQRWTYQYEPGVGNYSRFTDPSDYFYRLPSTAALPIPGLRTESLTELY